MKKFFVRICKWDTLCGRSDESREKYKYFDDIIEAKNYIEALIDMDSEDEIDALEKNSNRYQLKYCFNNVVTFNEYRKNKFNDFYEMINDKNRRHKYFIFYCKNDIQIELGECTIR